MAAGRIRVRDPKAAVLGRTTQLGDLERRMPEVFSRNLPLAWGGSESRFESSSRAELERAGDGLRSPVGAQFEQGHKTSINTSRNLA